MSLCLSEKILLVVLSANWLSVSCLWSISFSCASTETLLWMLWIKYWAFMLRCQFTPYKFHSFKRLHHWSVEAAKCNSEHDTQLSIWQTLSLFSNELLLLTMFCVCFRLTSQHVDVNTQSTLSMLFHFVISSAHIFY